MKTVTFTNGSSPRCVTLRQNHNKWVLTLGELELRALVSMVHLEVGSGWAEHESPEMSDAAARLHAVLLQR